MKFIRGLQNFHKIKPGCVLTIGNFDGVHLGHQALLNSIKEQAVMRDVPAYAMIFEPQPREVFLGEKAPARLQRLREKILALSACGIDGLICLPFNAKFAATSAESFITDILVKQLGVQYLVVGHDFRFGHKRQGDYAMLQQASEQYDFELEQVGTISYQDQAISSTRIRKALADGELDLAAELLGRPYSMFGKVAHGDKRGREWGMPTANIHVKRLVTPLHGIYVVRARLGERVLPAVASIGTRPTVDGSHYLLEVHILDFDEQIYGQTLEVEFLKFLRGEEKFDSIEALKDQMFQDLEDTRLYFAE